MKVTTFDKALAERGNASLAIMHCLSFPFGFAISKGEAYAIQAKWVLDNAAAIHQHQSGTQTDNLEDRVAEIAERIDRTQTFAVEVDQRNEALAARIQALEADPDCAIALAKSVHTREKLRLLTDRVKALEDAPGPRPNADEVSALRQRMDALTELLQKQTKLDKPWEDALARVERDVAALQDLAIICLNTDFSDPDEMSRFPEKIQGLLPSEPQTPEARKLLGLDVATPDPEPVYEWVGNDYYFDGNAVGGVCQIFNGNWLGHAHDGYTTQTYEPTESEARSWVEAQFNTPK